MTKRFIVMAVFACTLIGGVLVSDVRAEEDDIAPEKVALIKTHCTGNQATLNTLHQNDAFLRTNRGDLYRTINDKLMLPFNQRMVANQLNAGQLISITADFKIAYTKFFDSYIEYDNALADLLKISCKKEPVRFYGTLVGAREKRATLSRANQELVQLITDYHKTFQEFKTKHIQENSSS